MEQLNIVLEVKKQGFITAQMIALLLGIYTNAIYKIRLSLFALE